MQDDLQKQYTASLTERTEELKAFGRQLQRGTAEAEQNLRKLAHSLHGSGGTFGFPQISEAARVVEQCSTELLPQKLVDLVQVIQQIITAAPGQAIDVIDILIIDDDTEFANAPEKSFVGKSSQYRASLAATGARAEELLVKRKFALILLDLVLPDRDGRDLLREIKYQYKLATPVYVLSGIDRDMIRVECMALGAESGFATMTVSTASVSGMAIMVAEDDAMQANLVRQRLQREGMVVDVVNNGKDAVANMRDKPYAVYILDINMPGMSGFEVLRRIRHPSRLRARHQRLHPQALLGNTVGGTRQNPVEISPVRRSMTAFANRLQRSIIRMLSVSLCLLPTALNAQVPAQPAATAVVVTALPTAGAMRSVSIGGRMVELAVDSLDNPLVLLQTTQGDIVLELFPQEAPETVANFISLASGSKAFTDPATGMEAMRPFYDGLVFHRVIDGFMIQGGSPTGFGDGFPGYRFSDEISAQSLGLDKMLVLDASGVPNPVLGIQSQADFQQKILGPLYAAMGITSQEQLDVRIGEVDQRIRSMTVQQSHEMLGYHFRNDLQSRAPVLGVIAMANSGPDTNGSQFFITLADTPWLTGKHTVFGEVKAGIEVVDAIGKVAVDAEARPLQPVTLLSVRPL